MTTSTLFGIALAPLFAAIAQIESENGRTSENVYQLSAQYVADVNRIAALTNQNVAFADSDVRDRAKAEQMMCIYLSFYGARYLRQTGKTPTLETLARIHNGGPNGWKAYSTKRFMRRILAVLDAAEEGGAE